MAKILSLVDIQTGEAIEAQHVSQSIIAFTGVEAYDVTLSGSFVMQGPLTGTPGTINQLTASYAITASHALNVTSPTLQDVTDAGSITTVTITGSNISASGFISASSFNATPLIINKLTASYAITSSYALNSGTSPFPFSGSAVITGSLVVSSSNQEQSLQLYGSGSTIFSIEGSRGTLFSVDDDESDGTLFSVNNVSGTPILEVQEDNTVKLGKQNGFGIVISGSNPLPSDNDAKILITGSIHNVGSTAYFDTNITASGNISSSGYISASSFNASSSVINELTASYAMTASHALNSDPFPHTGSADITGSLGLVGPAIITGSVIISGSDSTDLSVIGNSSVTGNSYISGNVGIGTSAGGDGAKLNVRGTSSISADNFGRIEIIPTTGDGNTGVIKQTTDGPRNSGNLQIQVDRRNEAGNLYFATNGNNKRMTINSSGNVGIGTTAPKQRLHVQGNITASGYVSASSFVNNTVGTINELTASYAITASHALNVATPTLQEVTDAGSITTTAITASIISASGNIFANLSEDSTSTFKTVIYNSSSGQFFTTGSYAGGGEIGTLQQVTDAGNSTTNTITASNLLITGTASINLLYTTYNSSSIIYSSGSTKFGDTFDDFHTFTGSISSTGSNVDFTGATGVSGSFSGSFEGSGSGITGVISSSYALTASHALNNDPFPYTGSADITGSLSVVGPTIITGSISVSGSVINELTASYAVTASHALNIANTFPYTGSAIISGSLKTVGVNASFLNGQFDLTSSIVVTVASKTINHRYYNQGSGNAYYFNSIESPYIDFYPGKVYKFDQSDSTNGTHRILFYRDAARSIPFKNNVITSSIAAGTAGAYTQITTDDYGYTPPILYYQCINHGYMGNAAYLQSTAVSASYANLAKTALIVETSSYTSRWNVTNNANTSYNFSGNGVEPTDANPTLFLTRGERYLFDLSVTSNLVIRDVAGGTNWIEGINYFYNPKTFQNDLLSFNVPMDVPSSLVYQDTIYGSAMIGNIYILNTGSATPTLQEVTDAGSITTNIIQTANIDTTGSIIASVDISASGDIFANKIGVGTSTPDFTIEAALPTSDVYFNGKDIGKGINYATSQNWEVKPSPSTATVFSASGYFGLDNPETSGSSIYGDFIISGSDGRDNSINWGTSHTGERTLIWKVIGQNNTSLGEGGWNKNINSVNNSSSYISIVYVKANNLNTNGNFYHGAKTSDTGENYTLNLDGTLEPNPIFNNGTGAGNLLQDVWCVSIGYIQANNDPNTTPNPNGGIYRLDTLTKIFGTNKTFKMGSGSLPIQSQRVYYSDAGNNGDSMSFVNPGFYEIDGFEPSLDEILNRSNFSNTASYAITAQTALFAQTASYVETSEYTTRWNVTNNGSSAYNFSGNGVGASDDNPTLFLTRGEKYLFNVNASGHPFQIRTSAGGSAYNDGITNNGAQTGDIIFEVQMDAPDSLAYQCTLHSAMVGNIYILNTGSAIPTLQEVTDAGSETTTAITASIISASGNIIANNVFVPSGGKISFDDSLDGTDQFIKGQDDYIIIDGDNSVDIRADTNIKLQSSLIDNMSGGSEFNFKGSLYLTSSISKPAFIDVKGPITASNISSSGYISASSFNSPSSVINELTASYAMTASYALNSLTSPFPFSGSAVITGSLLVSGSFVDFSNTPLTASNVSINDELFLSGSSSRLKIQNHSGFEINFIDTVPATKMETNIKSAGIFQFISADRGYGFGVGGTDFKAVIGSSSLATANTSIILDTYEGRIGLGTSTPDFTIEAAATSSDVYFNGKDIGKGINYATSQNWEVKDGEDGVQFSASGYFALDNPGTAGGSAYGDFMGRDQQTTGSENIEWGIDPFGQRSLIWRNTSIDLSPSQTKGGFGKNIYSLNKNESYMSVIYLKRTSGSGTDGATPGGQFFHGAKGTTGADYYTLGLNNVLVANPYFRGSYAISNLPYDVWCISVGIIQANNDSNTTTSPLGGIYRLDTGEKLTSNTTYKMGNLDAPIQTHRAFLYGSTTAEQILDFCNPGFYAIDGFEPTLSELTAGAVGGDDVFWSATGSDIYNDNTGKVGIGTSAPTTELDVRGSASFARDSFTSILCAPASADGTIPHVIRGFNKFPRNGADLKIQVDSYTTGGNLIFATNGDNERMRVSRAGNVLIGTTNSSSRLNVEGGISTDILLVSGSAIISSSNSITPLTLQSSGSTVFEVQGSQGQLFSVTDDLIHDVLLVNDISGNELFKVSGSGLVEVFEGSITTPQGTINSLTASHAMNIQPENNFMPVATHTSNFTSTSSYAGYYNVVGGNLAITVTTGSSPTDLTPGMEWNFFQTASAGNFTFTAGTGVSILSRNMHTKLAAIGSAGTLKYISNQEFHLIGDLTL